MELWGKERRITRLDRPIQRRRARPQRTPAVGEVGIRFDLWPTPTTRLRQTARQPPGCSAGPKTAHSTGMERTRRRTHPHRVSTSRESSARTASRTKARTCPLRITARVAAARRGDTARASAGRVTAVRPGSASHLWERSGGQFRPVDRGGADRSPPSPCPSRPGPPACGRPASRWRPRSRDACP